jgi:putative transposase
MTIKQIERKKGRKPQYPEYISLDILDSVIKSGADPMAMMAQMKKALMERVMEAELDHHLEHDKNARTVDGNYRNGYGAKTVITDNGEVEINTPRDREGSFEPLLIPKRQRHFKGFDEKIISMYGFGMSTRYSDSSARDVPGRGQP